MNFFAPLLGQGQAVELLTQAVRQNRVAPAYLFAGPNGVGRSLAARCFIEQLFCAEIPPEKQQQLHRRLQLSDRPNHPDVLWVEPTYLHQGQLLTATEAAAAGLKRKTPPVIRTEQIRGITQFLSRPPLAAPRSVVVLEQAETMAETAANALLKTLEEPGKATLILIAPAAEAILSTLVSRCQRIPFYRLEQTTLAQVLRQNNYEQILTQPPILAIAQGSPGGAIAAWHQLQKIPAALLQKASQLPLSLSNALELARQIDKTLETEAQLWLISYLQQCYWQQFLAGKILPKTESLPQASPLKPLEAARSSLLSYAQPRLVWEVALIKLSQANLLSDCSDF